MKKLKDTIPNGGAPLGQFPVIRELFDSENKNAIEAILNSIINGETEGVILKGCNVSGTSGSFAISDGYVYIDGEVLYYPGVSGAAATQYILKAAATEEGGVFADGSFKNYIDVNVATEVSTAPGTGQYITVTFADGGRSLKKLLNDSIRSEDNGTVIRQKLVDIPSWNMDTSSIVSISIGIPRNKIRGLDISILSDSGYLNVRPSDVFLLNDPQTDSATSTTISLERLATGIFDNTDHDSTTGIRGYLLITYVL